MDVSLTRRIHRENGLERLCLRFKTPDRSWTGLVGPSGCGKTTALRMIAGLERPESGHVRAPNGVWFSQQDRICLPVHRRRCGFVFQDPSLFPHLTVHQNIAFGCRDSRFPDRLLDEADMSSLRDRSIHHLSGGQQQRIALLRAIAADPAVLLLDEPFSALDEDRSNSFKELLIHFFEKQQFDVILVSHDLADVRNLCETVVHVDSGVIESGERFP